MILIFCSPDLPQILRVGERVGFASPGGVLDPAQGIAKGVTPTAPSAIRELDVTSTFRYFSKYGSTSGHRGVCRACARKPTQGLPPARSSRPVGHGGGRHRAGAWRAGQHALFAPR